MKPKPVDWAAWLGVELTVPEAEIERFKATAEALDEVVEVSEALRRREAMRQHDMYVGLFLLAAWSRRRR